MAVDSRRRAAIVTENSHAVCYTGIHTNPPCVCTQLDVLGVWSNFQECIRRNVLLYWRLWADFDPRSNSPSQCVYRNTDIEPRKQAVNCMVIVKKSGLWEVIRTNIWIKIGEKSMTDRLLVQKGWSEWSVLEQFIFTEHLLSIHRSHMLGILNIVLQYYNQMQNFTVTRPLILSIIFTGRTAYESLPLCERRFWQSIVSYHQLHVFHWADRTLLELSCLEQLRKHFTRVNL